MSATNHQSLLGLNICSPLHLASDAIRQALSSVNPALSPDTFRATIDAMRGFQVNNADSVLVTPDIVYGPDVRQKFNWYEPTKQPDFVPSKVLLFVHGGGFVGGDKREPDSPLYDNIGRWAAAHGMYAATINYRLAPQHPWPAGAEDVRLAVQAVAARVRSLIGTPAKVVAMGHSGGAVHVAGAVTLREPPPEVIGCVLLSGIYDNTIGKPNPAYFGERPELYSSQSSLPGLALSDIPLFLAVSELEPIRMHVEAISVMKARLDNEKTLPQFVVLDGNNHYSSVLLLNSVVDLLGPRLLEFFARIDSCCT